MLKISKQVSAGTAQTSHSNVSHTAHGSSSLD